MKTFSDMTQTELKTTGVEIVSNTLGLKVTRKTIIPLECDGERFYFECGNFTIDYRQTENGNGRAFIEMVNTIPSIGDIYISEV